MKTRQNNYVIDYTGVVYVKNEIGISWPIELGVYCGEN